MNPIAANPDLVEVSSQTGSLPSVHDQLERPLRDLRISVIDRCNLRCNYCMPQEKFGERYNYIAADRWLTFEHIIRLIRIFVSLGVRKIRLTGGEPLLRPGLPELIERIKTSTPLEDLALTTNGILLKNMAQSLKQTGLDRLTVSLDTLDEKIFQAISGHRAQIKDVLAGIQAAKEEGFFPIKLNAVIQKGVNDDGIMDLVEYTRREGHILRFIEYMDVGNCNHWDYRFVVPSAEIIKRIEAHFPLEPLDPNYKGEVSRRYQFKEAQGEIGFVSSVSEPFCGSCTRARISPEGKFYTCLFGSDGVSLRDLLLKGAGDDALRELIRETWRRRRDRYSEERLQKRNGQAPQPKVEMYQIGG